MELRATNHTEVTTLSYHHFTRSERESLAEMLREGKNYSQIAKEMGRHRSTIAREVKRNFSKKKKRYNPWRATILYWERRNKSVRHFAIEKNSMLYEYILVHLQKYWPPEVIAVMAKKEGYIISCSTIYRALNRGIFGHIAKKKYLRRKGKNYRLVHHNSNTIHPDHTIHERPDIVERKLRIGDWEGDTVCGAVGKGCLVTLVDRKSKLLLAARSPSRNSQDIRKAFQNAFSALDIDIPIHTITLDNGTEFAAFRQIEQDHNATIYFAAPHSPWQRGLNENTNDLLRFFFPKGANFLEVTDEDVRVVVQLLNSRPRKSLGYISPLAFFSSACCT